MSRRRTPEERYKYNIRKEQKSLEEFATYEIEWAGDLLTWYRITKKEIPDDEYRSCAFFLNREFKNKPGSLSLLYTMYLQWCEESPIVTRENAFDVLCYRYKMYAAVLKTGGYDG